MNRFVCPLILCVAMTGCASSVDIDEDPETVESEGRRKPTGNENWANLTVKLPTGTCQPGGSCANPLGTAAVVTVDAVPIALATKTRLKPGDRVLSVNGISQTVTLSPGRSKSLTLAVAKRKCVAAGLPTVGQTDFGRDVRVTTAACPDTLRLQGARVAFADEPLAYVPGTYEMDVDGTQQSVALRAASVKEVTVNLPTVGTVPTIFKTNLKFKEARELPDARATTITSSCAGERSYTVPQNASGTLNLSAFENRSCKYTLTAGAGRTVDLEQSRVNDISLFRIDVDDAEVAREDGTTYTTRGTYELYFGGALVAGPFSTNSGVDVLPGTYELVIKYNTADGTQVDRHPLTF